MTRSALLLLAAVSLIQCSDAGAPSEPRRVPAATQSISVASTSAGTSTPAPIATPVGAPTVAPPTAALPAAAPPRIAAVDLLTYLRLPVDCRARFVHDATVDRPADGMVRLMWISPEALTAVKAGESLPEETVIVMEVYAAARAEDGRLARDAAGRLMPGRLDAILLRATLADDDDAPVAEERVPEGARNGAWDYVTIDPDSGRIGTLNNTACHACHLVAEAWDYAFTQPQLILAARTSEAQHATCERVGRQPCATPGP